MEPLTGDDPGVVAGYQLRARLGAGGMGRVYLAFTPGGRAVALKMIRPELGDDPDFRNRFRQEVAAARRVHGLYTAQVLDADPDAARPWLVTAYVPGPSLHQAVADHGPLPTPTLLLLISGVAEALQAIHAAGVVHRDLKPSNVLLAPDGPRVIDFGIARAAEATALTRSGMRVGSPQFMAPEQVAGLAVVTPAIDVFALGSLAAYAATGLPPFGEGSEAAVLYRVLHEPASLDGCPAQLRDLIGRCLAKDPAARPMPAEIITFCRSGTSGETVEMTQPWLPPAMAGALAQHLAPPPWPAPPEPIAEPPAPAPPEPAPTVRGQPAPAVPAPGLAAPGLAAPGLAAAAVPAAAGQPEIGAAPADMAVGAPTVPTAGVTRVGDGPPFRPRSRFRRNLIAGLTAVAVLGGCIGAAALILDKPAAHQRSSSGASHGPQTRQAAGHATATPSLSSLLDPCLVGTWKGDSEDATVTIDGAPVQFTGAGATQTYRPDGTAVFNYGKRMVYRAPLVNGNRWEQILRGRATIFWEIQDKLLLTSGVKAHGSWELIENGGYDNGGPLSLNTAPERYTCTSTTLREFPVNGGPLVLTRKQPAPQPGS